MLRSLFVNLSIFGFLLCPFRCASMADACGAAEVCTTCCCSDVSADDSSSQPGPQPGGDGCDHECIIAKSTVPSVQRTPKEFVRSMMDLGGLISVAPAEAVDAACIDPLHQDGPTSQCDTASRGILLRVELESLLL